MKRHLTDEYAIIMLLLTVSLLSFAPVYADQGQTGTVVFHLTGQAAPMNVTGPSGSTTLDLVGNVQGDGNGGLIIQNLTGNLQMGSENYTITTGHGDLNKRGEFVIFGETGSGQLILHGSIQNNQTVIVNSPPSRLSSLAYLSLSGSMRLNSVNDSLISTSVSVGQNSTSSIVESVRTNGTSEATQFESTSSVTANVTSLTEGAATNVIINQSLTGINSTTVSELNNETVSNVLPGPTAFTVTTTQLGNQTITVYVTQTVANSTLTTTSTAANATITQTTVTTVANATVTVTNSTNSAP